MVKTGGKDGATDLSRALIQVQYKARRESRKVESKVIKEKDVESKGELLTELCMASGPCLSLFLGNINKRFLRSSTFVLPFLIDCYDLIPNATVISTCLVPTTQATSFRRPTLSPQPNEKPRRQTINMAIP